VTSVLPIDNDLLKWISGLIVGGGAAATIQGGSVLTRLASSKLTAGSGNPIVATGEHAAYNTICPMGKGGRILDLPGICPDDNRDGI